MRTVSIYFKLLLILALIAVTIAATYLLEQTVITVQAPEWSATLSVPFAILALLFILVVLSLLRKAVVEFFFIPGRLRRWRSTRQTTRAEQLLLNAQQELAAHRYHQAEQAIEQLHRRVEPGPLSRSLEARVALALGEYDRSERVCRQLLDDEATKANALSGLILTAIGRDNPVELASWLEQLRPQREIGNRVIESTFTAIGAYVTALAPERQNDLETVLQASDHWLLQARDFVDDGTEQNENAALLARCLLLKAKFAPGQHQPLIWLQYGYECHWRTAIADYVTAMIAAKQPVAKLIENCWQQSPSLALARLYLESAEPLTALQQLARLEKLSGLATFPPTVFGFAIQTAIEAQVWGRAQSWIELWQGQVARTAAVINAAASLELAHNGDSSRYRQLCQELQLALAGQTSEESTLKSIADR